MAADDGASVLSKRVLVELSHAIERFALAAEPDAPLVVIALFQKLSYFEREVAVYADIARRGTVTVVGLARTSRRRCPRACATPSSAGPTRWPASGA
jgi:DICT domain-containing protein